MKRLILTLFFLCAYFSFLCAQSVAVSKRMNITKAADGTLQSEAKAPPLLDIVSNSIKFIDENNNNLIDANEKCQLHLQIKNSGKGKGEQCFVKLSATGDVTGLTYSNLKLPDILSGQTIEAVIPVVAGMDTKNGKVIFHISIEEPRGFGCDPLELAINTCHFIAPLVQVSDYSVTSDQGFSISKRVPFNLQILIQNIQQGMAEHVQASIELPPNVLLMDGNRNSNIGTLAGGQVSSITYSLVVNNTYQQSTIPITIKLAESSGKYANDRTINLQLNQSFAKKKINIESNVLQQNNIAIAQIEEKNRQADVDIDIPLTNSISDNTFAVIISNEDYQSEANVSFAINDGFIFATYCNKVLGLPEKNIHFRQNATLNNMKREIDWLKQVIGAYKGDAKVIFYYAGHGIPDEKENSTYLLPVDGYGTDTTTGYSLDDLYRALSEFPSQSVTIFLDACFSGSKREEGMLTAARGIVVKAKQAEPIGKMVIFSAAQGDETAFPYKEKGHGMFTYYLLKGLQKTKGNISMSELSNFVTNEVQRFSIVVNGKMQTPTIITSATLGDTWKEWKLK